jgi:AcrR family transcriptional regulator
MASRDGGGAAGPEGSARERILDTAYELFSRNGIRAVGIDRIIADAGIAKATLYRHFASKEQLVLAFLDLRERRWTREWLEAESERRAATQQDRLLIVFDMLNEWFHRPDYEGCSFINTLLEISDLDSPIHQDAVRRLAVIRELLERYAEEAGLPDPPGMSYQLQILMMGAIVSAGKGDLVAGRRARELAAPLLAAAPLR